jgi:RHS repeat-associated protein
VTTTNLYDGLHLLGETSGATKPTYVFGPGIDEPLAQYRAGTLSYFDADGLGTVAVTNDTAGNAALSTSFDAWGVARNETGTRLQPFTYMGREVGEAALLFYRARFLQPGVARFTQEDPTRFAATRSSYAYVANGPLVSTDPLGLPLWGRRVAPRKPTLTPMPKPRPKPHFQPGTPCWRQNMDSFKNRLLCCGILNLLPDAPTQSDCNADCIDNVNQEP